MNPIDSRQGVQNGVFRYTHLGIALRLALAQLSDEKKITPFLEMWVMKVFDTKIVERLGQLGDRGQQNVISFHAHWVTKHCQLNGGWEIHLHDVQIHSNGSYQQVKKLKILADNFS